jgi:NAD(P)-dependent dehydrogenase (short-subunit alcohol dehydrogenase family)
MLCGGEFERKGSLTDVYTPEYIAKNPANMAEGKTLVVTGATGNGIGVWCAKNAIMLGASKVILLNRTSERSVAAELEVISWGAANGMKAGAVVKTVDCDLSSFASVEACASKLHAECDGKIDVLMLNSATMASPAGTTVDGYNREIQVNVLSHFLLLKLCFPLLNAAAAEKGEARVVQQSSLARYTAHIAPVAFCRTAGELPAPFAGDNKKGMLGVAPAWQRYGQTKLANSLSSMILHEKLKAAGSKVKSLCVDPGLAATDLQPKAVEYRNMKHWEAKLVFGVAGQSPRDGALPMTHACFHPDVQSGDYYSPEKMVRACGLPRRIATAGEWANPSAEKFSVSEPALKEKFWQALEDAAGGQIIS